MVNNKRSHAQNDSNNQTEREIIKQLLIEKFPYCGISGHCALLIADWHLAEVKRIVEPLVDITKHIQYSSIMYPFNAIEETLKRANGGE